MDMGHALPGTGSITMHCKRQSSEKAFWKAQCSIAQGSRNVLGYGSRSYYIVDDSSELRPLFLRLGGPGGNDMASDASIRFGSDEVGDAVDVHAGHLLRRTR